MLIDTGSTGGSLGPWIAWSSNGSALKEIKAKSWVIRGKDDHSNKFEHNIPAFEKGVVLDLDTLKLGWEREGIDRPERRWNPSLSQAMPRPSDEKKPQGGYVWTNALSVRVALGQGETATWEQGQFAAYEGFRRLAAQINEQSGSNPNKLPLVKQTGVETIKLSSGTANIPLLTIASWVDRPECLKDGGTQIATEPAPAMQAAKPPAAPPPPVDDDLEF